MVAEKANPGPKNGKYAHGTCDISILKVAKRFMSEIETEEKFHLCVGSCALLVNALTNMLYPRVIGTIIDTKGLEKAIEGSPWCPQYSIPVTSAYYTNPPGGDCSYSNFRDLLMYSLPLYISGSLASWIRVCNMHYAVYLIQKRSRRKMFKKLLRQGAPFFQTNLTSSLMSKLLNDCEEGPKVFLDSYSQFLRSCNSTFGGTINLFLISPILTSITLLSIPIFGVCVMAYSSIIRKAQRSKKQCLDDVISKAEEVISGIRDVMSFGKEDYEISSFSSSLDKCDSIAYRVCNSEGILMGSILAGFNLCTLLILYFGSRQMRFGALSVGNLASFILYGGMIGLGASGLSKTISDVSKSSVSLKRIYDIYDLPDTDYGSLTLDKVEGMIEFEDVSFSYGPADEELVLDGFSLKIEPGEIVAIVGPNGAGKSTLCSLLTTMYRPTRGRILLDGVDLRSLNSKWVRQEVFSVVPQEPILFSMCIGDNIKYGKDSATFEEVCRVSKMCNVECFVESLPLKYMTQIGPRGTTLSVGQKKRVALARAILKGTPCMIFDEATSALDGPSEEMFASAVKSEIKGKTIIIITHKASTLKLAQKVAVLNNHKLEFFGTVDEAKVQSETFRTIFPGYSRS